MILNVVCMYFLDIIFTIKFDSFQTQTSDSVEDYSMHYYNTCMSLLNMSTVMWPSGGD